MNQFGRDYQSPEDGTGHGTHMASTAAGTLFKHTNLFGFVEGTTKEIASNARIAMYKAGEIETPYYTNNIARSGFAAMMKGIFVICAAGNDGPLSKSVVNTAP
ncbi:Subtilisin-like protease SBT1.8 [Camellia lanceoleosa]|uniref:Subtilisin-like protease SBT1.8 n=1 Tax=Camellia lanceoleosa TaxID=1840588 RepID=A0ACC0J140_9ERIC|nr:Subtilisin-like protease SBT1.8 [Camellia lanceoleosa]